METPIPEGMLLIKNMHLPESVRREVDDAVNRHFDLAESLADIQAGIRRVRKLMVLNHVESETINQQALKDFERIKFAQAYRISENLDFDGPVTRKSRLHYGNLGKASMRNDFTHFAVSTDGNLYLLKREASDKVHSLLGANFVLRGSLDLREYDCLFPSFLQKRNEGKFGGGRRRKSS